MDVDEFGGNRRTRPAPRNFGNQTTREADLNAAIQASLNERNAILNEED